MRGGNLYTELGCLEDEESISNQAAKHNRHAEEMATLLKLIITIDCHLEIQ